MAEQGTLHTRLDNAELRLESPAPDAPGDARRSRDSAVRQVRAVLEAAIADFLRTKGYHRDRPPIRHLIHLLKREFRQDRQLALEVAHTLAETSAAMHPLDAIAAPPIELVRYWLSVARRFLDALDPILAEHDANVRSTDQ